MMNDMTKQKNDMTWIGTVQGLGKPYADLYIDKEKNNLFLLVRVTKPSDSVTRYAAISVTPDQVMDYMENKRPIADVFSSCPFHYAYIEDKKVNMDEQEHISSANTFQFNRSFDPELCSNRIKLKVAMKRMMNITN